VEQHDLSNSRIFVKADPVIHPPPTTFAFSPSNSRPSAPRWGSTSHYPQSTSDTPFDQNLPALYHEPSERPRARRLCMAQRLSPYCVGSISLSISLRSASSPEGIVESLLSVVTASLDLHPSFVPPSHPLRAKTGLTRYYASTTSVAIPNCTFSGSYQHHDPRSMCTSLVVVSVQTGLSRLLAALLGKSKH
jgi:hypothetical protein